VGGSRKVTTASSGWYQAASFSSSDGNCGRSVLTEAQVKSVAKMGMVLEQGGRSLDLRLYPANDAVGAFLAGPVPRQ